MHMRRSGTNMSQLSLPPFGLQRLNSSCCEAWRRWPLSTEPSGRALCLEFEARSHSITEAVLRLWIHLPQWIVGIYHSTKLGVFFKNIFTLFISMCVRLYTCVYMCVGMCGGFGGSGVVQRVTSLTKVLALVN